MKKSKSLALITVLILSLLAASCGQTAKESPSEAVNAGDTVAEAAENAENTEDTVAEAADQAGNAGQTVSETAGDDEEAGETGTGETFPAGNPEEVAAVILHTNDVHVGLEDNIGYDGLALYKKELEAQYDHVLLIDAGDAIQGAAIGAMSKGAEIIRIMNRVGYDLAIPGNHEFDFGFDVLDDCSETLSCG